MTLNLTIPQITHTDFTPRITVIGVGGGGTNAVDNMIALNLQGVEFVVANTDAQQLLHSRAERRIQLGPHLTQGLGAGAKPEIGKAAAEEAQDELYRHLDGSHMVFITAGMGGGTGTGAAPVIARMARERGILTVGVVTKPFGFEGGRRLRSAEQGIEELQQYVDTLIVIPNQNLFRMANERTTWKDAFKMADQVLYMGVRGVTDLMMVHGLVNLDFADIRTVMAEMGKAMMGTGEADGDNRAIRAAEAAINNPLLEDTSMAGARGLLINITGGDDLTLFEVDQAANRIREEVDEEANVIFGSAVDESLNGRIRVSVVATGIDTPRGAQQRPHLVAVNGGAMPEPQPIVGPARTDAAEEDQDDAQQAAGQSAASGFGGGQQTGGRFGGGQFGGGQFGGARSGSGQAAAPAAEYATIADGNTLRHVVPQPIVTGRGQVNPVAERAMEPRGQIDPVRPATQPQSPPLRQRDTTGQARAELFSDNARPVVAPPVSAPPARPATEMPGRRLFNAVTGVFGRRQSNQPSAAPQAPAMTQADHEHRAPMTAITPDAPPAPRQSRGDVGIEIPAFLRRQGS